MSDCPIERPQCKRKLMTSNKPYEQKQCPLNIKPRCNLLPPTCPLLPQDNPCGLSKIQNPNAPCDVTECPGKGPCLLAPAGCPISLECTDSLTGNGVTNNNNINNNNGSSGVTPNLPYPCPIDSCLRSKPPKEEQKVPAKSTKGATALGESKKVAPVPLKKQKVDTRCPVSSNVRPLPCAECILDDLSISAAGGDRSKVKACPFLKIADTCGPCCDCAEVPEVNIGPTCPFLPKPCPCCTAPRCPLSRKPDCIINPKPQCGLLKPPCCCGTNSFGSSCTPCSPPKCPLGQPACLCGTCIPSCSNPPKCICMCGLCPPGCGTCPLNPTGCGKCPLNPPGCSPCPLNPSSCLCGGCPLGSPCPLKSPKCVCGSCPLTLTPCLPRPCCCSCGQTSCPLNPTPCPLNPPKCPAVCSLKPPICPGSCPLSAIPCPLTSPPTCPPCDPCPLLRKPICPPIPPPCSINKYELQPTPPKTTFHVPLCPQYKPPCELHLKSTGSDDLICPFSPHPCPLGETCPFPIALSKKEKYTTMKEIDQGEPLVPKAEQTKKPARDVCPGSNTCGILPQPECPVAEIICPELYKKKKKEKKEPCPFKECMKKPECPFSKAMPDVNCPMAEDSNCPLAKEPDCPVAELANKCSLAPTCCACLPPGCPLSTCPSKPSCPLPLTKTSNKQQTQNTLKVSTCPLSSPIECVLSSITADCPLKPKIDCPLAAKPGCPLAPSPECPLKEFSAKSGCPAQSMGCPLAPEPKCPITGKVNPCPLVNRPQCVLTEILPERNNKPTIIPPCVNEVGISLKTTSREETATETQQIWTNVSTPKNRYPAGSPKSPPVEDSSECILSQINTSTNLPKQANNSETKTDGMPRGREDMYKSNPKTTEKECPLTNLIPKRNCPLEPPKCPLTPKPACPLTQKPEPCPLTLDKNKRNCPVEYPPCGKFPKGRCPMESLNLCDCDYPVSPCLLPPQGENVTAPPQYCVKENCCMGLPLPPIPKKTKKSSDSLGSDDYYYKFVDTKPGKEETKHYVQVLKEPPKLTIGIFGEPKERLHNNWTIVKGGEGYKRCKTIANQLKNKGQSANTQAQYKDDDIPMDVEVMRVMENRKIQKTEENEIKMLRLSLGLEVKK